MRDTKKVCLFIGSLGAGGAERVMAWLAEQLVCSNYEIVLVTLSGTESDIQEIDHRITRICLNSLKKNNFLLKPWANITRAFMLRRILLRYQSDTLIAFMPHESILAILASINLKTRVIISERNAPWRRSAGNPWNTFRKLLYRFAAVQIAQTRPVANWLSSTAKCKNPIIIPNAVLPKLRTRAPILDPANFCNDERKVILSVGSKAYQKGFDILVQAFSLLSEKYPEWDLVIVGLEEKRIDNGMSKQNILSLVNQYSLAERVTLCEQVGNIDDWYKRADVFALSSRFEGFPNVLLEAMARSCACVAFDCETGPSDIINHQSDGLLVSGSDAADFSLALESVMANVKLRENLQLNAARSMKRFSESTILGRWRAVIDKKGY